MNKITSNEAKRAELEGFLELTEILCMAGDRIRENWEDNEKTMEHLISLNKKFKAIEARLQDLKSSGSINEEKARLIENRFNSIKNKLEKINISPL